jgi:hypothetical protein
MAEVQHREALSMTEPHQPSTVFGTPAAPTPTARDGPARLRRFELSRLPS